MLEVLGQGKIASKIKEMDELNGRQTESSE
jgi:hypothetical protein